MASNDEDFPRSTSTGNERGVAAHVLLGIVAPLRPKTALNGREIAEAAGLSSREVQQVLPLLSKMGRVNRSKPIGQHSRGNSYRYWMSDSQRSRFESLVEQTRRSKIFRNTAQEFERLSQENERLQRELDDRKRATGAEALRIGTVAQASIDATQLAERLIFIRQLRERPALAQLAMLEKIEKDYEQALSITRSSLKN